MPANNDWRSPRSAISYPWLSYEQQHRRAQKFADFAKAQQQIALQHACLKKEIFRYADFLEKARGAARAGAFYRYCSQKIIPRIDAVNQHWQLEGILTPTSQAIFNSHFDEPFMRFLASRLVNMVSRYNRMPDMSKAEIDNLAEDIASLIRSELADMECDELSDLKTLHRWYMHAALLCQQFDVVPPQWKRITQQVVDEKDLAPSVMRMLNERWWRKHLQRASALWREHLYIALGSVSRKQHPYISHHGLKSWREQKHRTREFLKGMELEDEEGNRISLIDKYDCSNANPAIRRSELMVRLRGFENICTELGYIGEFCTLTAPSKYHATRINGYANTAWNGANPQETQSWFNRIWACIRARLHRESVHLFGIRVAEPHHDGTPHWHLLLFMPPQEREKVMAIIREYVMKEDAHELQQQSAQNARFQTQSIDPEKGSATGYIAKFISKNVDGYALDGETDHESGRHLKEQAASVCAWASRWRIRQFQFIGGAPVTVYRELRRLTNSTAAQSVSHSFADAHTAADTGDWQGYIHAQGGPFVSREHVLIRPLYLSAERFNDYGEEIVTLRGLYDTQKGKHRPLITRTRQWKIVPRRAETVSETDSPNTVASWSSVINCTPPCPLPAEWDLKRPLNRPQRRNLTRWLRRIGPPARQKTPGNTATN